ncbi:MAG: GNAT family N-acetyltransferase [Haliscomenobacter sp.]|nr:GNAT family N-acetyltransferase [Haliscomenobacter sp.]
MADLCVLPEFRKQGIATGLLQAVESLGKENQVEFVVLAAASQSWFAKRGYLPVDGQFKWLMIHENQSLGIASRRLSKTIMVKPLSSKPWEEGPVDFLGHIF